MKRALCAIFALLLFVCAAPPGASAASAVLTSADPATVMAGSASLSLTIAGQGFENQGHPDMDEYNHWFIRRVEQNGTAGEWQHCGTGAGACRSTGWNASMGWFTLDASWFAQPGAIEFRYFRGLATPDETDPANAHGVVSPYTNVLRIAVVMPNASVAVPAKPVAGTMLVHRAAGLDVRREVATAIQTSVVTLTCSSPAYRDTTGGVLLASSGLPVRLRAGEQIEAYPGTVDGKPEALRRIRLQTPQADAYVYARCAP